MDIWETQEAEEAARNAQWEEINSATYDKAVLESIQSNLDDAFTAVCKAMDELEAARKQIAYLPLEDDIKECINNVESAQDDILELQNLVGKEMSA